MSPAEREPSKTFVSGKSRGSLRWRPTQWRPCGWHARPPVQASLPDDSRERPGAALSEIDREGTS